MDFVSLCSVQTVWKSSRNFKYLESLIYVSDFNIHQGQVVGRVDSTIHGIFLMSVFL